MQRVPVVDKDGIPLMPCKASRARRMVRNGKAVGKRNKLGIYYIQLIDEPSNRETQPISAGIDPGKYYSGIGLQSSKFTLFTAHLFLPFETVKKRMEQRRMMRRSRTLMLQYRSTGFDSSQPWQSRRLSILSTFLIKSSK